MRLFSCLRALKEDHIRQDHEKCVIITKILLTLTIVEIYLAQSKTSLTEDAFREFMNKITPTNP